MYLLPRGKTKANTESIIAAFYPGQVVIFPQSMMVGNGILPENFVLDADVNGSILYGCGYTE
jgi:hypothetical protein